MKVISDTDLQELTHIARTSERLRKNLNLHKELSDPVQRLCNAFEPGTYVRPHRHPEKNKWELFVVLKGEAVILAFDEDGVVKQRITLSDQGPNYIIEIPAQTWHTVITRKTGTILFEVKQGPYSALTDKDFAKWAPDENGAMAGRFLDWLEQAQTGDLPPALPA